MPSFFIRLIEIVAMLLLSFFFKRIRTCISGRTSPGALNPGPTAARPAMRGNMEERQDNESTIYKHSTSVTCLRQYLLGATGSCNKPNFACLL